MKTLLRGSLFAALVLLTASAPKAQVAIGISIGAPPPPRVIRVHPVQPAADYLWVEGYWYPVGNHYKWHEGYWTRPPYGGAHWIGPRYEGGRYFAGYWDGPRGHFDHDHHWDRDHDRDFRDHDHDRDHDRDNDHGHGHSWR